MGVYLQPINFGHQPSLLIHLSKHQKVCNSASFTDIHLKSDLLVAESDHQYILQELTDCVKSLFKPWHTRGQATCILSRNVIFYVCKCSVYYSLNYIIK